MKKDGKIPVVEIYSIQHRLGAALDAQSWDECTQLANEVIDQIRLAINPSTSQTGTPHLDGVFCVGMMRYEAAPKATKRALNKMNRILRTAKRTLG